MQFADFPALAWSKILAEVAPGFEQTEAIDFVSKLVQYESGHRMRAHEVGMTTFCSNIYN